MSVIDLHFHSNYSDGLLSVEELAVLIRAKGLKYCSLTDHNSVAGLVELREILKNTEIIFIPGVELNALYGDNEIHLLAYDFDINEMAEILVELNELIEKMKENELVKAITLFNNQGIKITPDLKPDNKKPVGYTLSKSICEQEVNQKLFLSRHGKNLLPEDLYYLYQAPGKSCAVARSGVTVEWLIDKLKNKVADLIIAHPFVSPSIACHPLSPEDIVSLLKLGLSGLELYHKKTTDEEFEWLKKIVTDMNLNYTGGSDFHKHSHELGQYNPGQDIPNFKLTNFKSN